ncbi:DDE superfamily endonuclease, partial [Nitrosomonas communis]
RVRVLMDSWYMRQYVISTMLNRGFDVIGQVRRDTRLYDVPAPRLESQRGRSRKYGEKLTPEQTEQFLGTTSRLPGAFMLFSNQPLWAMQWNQFH